MIRAPILQTIYSSTPRCAAARCAEPRTTRHLIIVARFDPCPTIRPTGAVWATGLGFDEFRGVKATDKPLLDLRAVGLAPAHRNGRPRRAPGTADLTVLQQVWLRRLVQRWVEIDHLPARTFNQTLRAATIASRALAARPGGGHDPAALKFTDMSAVLAAIWSQTHSDGRAYSANTAANWRAVWFKLLDFGGRAELLDELGASFVRDRNAHPRPRQGRHSRDDTIDAQPGNAIPESVIAQLDTHLEALGEGPVYGTTTLPAEDLKAMYQTAYVLLRDTGRRPNEIASLGRDCLEQHRGEVSLIWDNHKSGRLRRRLPITTATAQSIWTWSARRERLAVPARGERFLFPALSSDSLDRHLPANTISAAIRLWADQLPVPMRRLRLLPARPLLPDRDRGPHQRAARGLRDRPSDGHRRIRAHRDDRRDQRLRRRRGHDAHPAGRSPRRRARRDRDRLGGAAQDPRRRSDHTPTHRHRPRHQHQHRHEHRHEHRLRWPRMSVRQRQTAALREARRRDSLTKRARVLQALTELEDAGDPISVAALARRAQVSTWLVYSEGVREHLTAAQARQAAAPATQRRSGRSPSTASLRTDLELARAEIATLRAERDQLRNGMRQQLGRSLDALSSAELASRVAELNQLNQQLAEHNHRLGGENATLAKQVEDLEAELAAARTSLRRMIREQKIPDSATDPRPLR
jgi:hypothetical protein